MGLLGVNKDKAKSEDMTAIEGETAGVERAGVEIAGVEIADESEFHLSKAARALARLTGFEVTLRKDSLPEEELETGVSTSEEGLNIDKPVEVAKPHVCKGNCARLKVDPCKECTLGLTLQDCSDNDLLGCQFTYLLSKLLCKDDKDFTAALKGLLKETFGYEYNPVIATAMLGYVSDMLKQDMQRGME